MNVIRTTTLAIGASLIGSSLFIFLAKPDALSLIILAMGVMSLLHGTGFLQEFIVRKILRWCGTKKPVIGIVNDLPWSPRPEKGTYAWAWSKMEPGEWYSKIDNAIKKSKINAKPKLIKITTPLRRWFLDRYLVIVNPYGSVYPEVDIKELTIWKSILYYVLHGGRFVNVADIPFYWAYDPKREIRYEMVKYFHQYVPMYKRSSDDVLHPVSGGIISFDYLDSVAINRGVVVGKVEKGERKIEVNHVKSMVEELEWDGKLVTPFCSIYFGKGKFLVSLAFLEYDKQQEDIREKITIHQCDLVIKEVKDILRN
ncbi:MAG: hypothetical protein B5M53_12630 [Candidatus Cloacimonas sp. 4484_209]|nr:MAG: hypothetical protein B5M53_12630 [Candidatus Cloacimonas sp. 4484_209]